MFCGVLGMEVCGVVNPMFTGQKDCRLPLLGVNPVLTGGKDCGCEAPPDGCRGVCSVLQGGRLFSLVRLSPRRQMDGVSEH